MKKLKNIDEIQLILEGIKNKNIVFTNGCFDVLHSGHIKYLEISKGFGDLLIVGLNSDESIRRIKGKNRPINYQKDRAYMLSALEFVDYIVIFDDDTPYNLINQIKPDIITKGADYSKDEVVGADIVNEVKLIDLFGEQSTTKLIEKIKKINEN